MSTPDSGTPDDIPDPRSLTKALWEVHGGMNAGVNRDGITPPSCYCGAPLDTPNGSSWPEAAAAFHRHLWAELKAMTALNLPGSPEGSLTEGTR